MHTYVIVLSDDRDGVRKYELLVKISAEETKDEDCGYLRKFTYTKNIDLCPLDSVDSLA